MRTFPTCLSPRPAAVDWQERCRRLLAKRNTAARLDAALAAVAQSVDSAVDQFERRLDVSAPPAAAQPAA